jgi:uncharacterized membrane protein
MREALSVLVLLGSGTTMGVFFAVAVSVAPALATMPPARYIETHRLLGRGYHPAMPIITNVTMLSGFALAIMANEPAARWLFLTGAVLVIGVQAVSHLGNVPINRTLQQSGTAPDASTWTDPRPRWRSWHLLRTALAVAAFAANSLAATLNP